MRARASSQFRIYFQDFEIECSNSAFIYGWLIYDNGLISDSESNKNSECTMERSETETPTEFRNSKMVREPKVSFQFAGLIIKQHGLFL